MWSYCRLSLLIVVGQSRPHLCLVTQGPVCGSKLENVCDWSQTDVTHFSASIWIMKTLLKELRRKVATVKLTSRAVLKGTTAGERCATAPAAGRAGSSQLMSRRWHWLTLIVQQHPMLEDTSLRQLWQVVTPEKQLWTGTTGCDFWFYISQ